MKSFLPFLVIVTALASKAMGLSLSSSTLTIASRTVGGSDPNRPQKVNQDALFHCPVMITKTGGSIVTCFGVMDGHGLKGHLVTQFLAKQLPQRIAEQLANPTPLTEWEEKMKQLANFDVQADVAASIMVESQDTQHQQQHHIIHNALRHAFHQAHVDAMEAVDVPAGRSGTTCIVCLLDDTHIHVAHVGDSRAVLYGTSSSWQALTSETTVANFASTEGQRIADGKGRVDGQGNVWYGPVGISMTRALGDAVMLQAGVVPTPIVQSFPRDDDKNHILVVATDGIWDVLDNDCVGEIVQQYQDASSSSSVQDLLDELIDQARKRWIGDLPIMDEEKVDDITCIVAKV